jgi:hypothetical protein
MVLSVADEYSTIGVNPDTVGARKLRLQWIATQGVAWLARAGECGQYFGPGVESADHVITGIGDEEIAPAIESDLVRMSQRRCERRAPSPE